MDPITLTVLGIIYGSAGGLAGMAGAKTIEDANKIADKATAKYKSKIANLEIKIRDVNAKMNICTETQKRAIQEISSSITQIANPHQLKLAIKQVPILNDSLQPNFWEVGVAASSAAILATLLYSTSIQTTTACAVSGSCTAVGAHVAGTHAVIHLGGSVFIGFAATGLTLGFGACAAGIALIFQGENALTEASQYSDKIDEEIALIDKFINNDLLEISRGVELKQLAVKKIKENADYALSKVNTPNFLLRILDKLLLNKLLKVRKNNALHICLKALCELGSISMLDENSNLDWNFVNLQR